ncbi:NAD(P)-dependent oxidoreductase [Falsiroseomonas selenitidurans]|uniref:2-hydroxyacid dehydrogenase n=1 Tax=Falsiroseomonas selenitidurans TaxID=2716335 RepID=A0ABX1E486_9PROT|nr:NAD(P)-dependent oxidoreductase [Falsiroseomonas selenitidurans]NKC30582.1 2-hydroxyacid dehydrogenase [Falsiroseomonas selenitidurans]
MAKPEILVLTPMVQPAARAALAERFTVHGPDQAEAALASHGPAIAGLVATGRERVDAALLDLLPGLRILACFSAGTDNIDAAALAARGIRLTTTSAVLAEEVADLAMALLVMARRRLVAADAHVRGGAWAAGQGFPFGRSIQGKRLGLLGYGHIGAAIARRAAAAGLALRYCARSLRPGLDIPFHATPLALARDSDLLMVASSGGAANRNLVDAAVIRALGPAGTLVNIARGEVVEEAALLAALEDGGLGSAGLDVFQDEPRVDPRFAALPNVVLAPHIASATVETRDAMGAHVVASLTEALLQGKA